MLFNAPVTFHCILVASYFVLLRISSYPKHAFGSAFVHDKEVRYEEPDLSLSRGFDTSRLTHSMLESVSLVAYNGLIIVSL